jgi:hypothetical protein
MLLRISTGLLAFILAGMMPLHGQDQPASAGAPGPIATDRQAVTNSSVVVPAGSLQVESGFVETGNQSQSIVDGPESLIRFGVASKTELRFTAPDYYYNLSTRGSSGFGDLAVGVKQQLGPTPHGFDVSVIVFISFPTGGATVSSGGYDPGLQVPFIFSETHELGEELVASYLYQVRLPLAGVPRLRPVSVRQRSLEVKRRSDGLTDGKDLRQRRNFCVAHRDSQSLSWLV